MDRPVPEPARGLPASRTLPALPLLTSRRHIDLLRVCSAAGTRRPGPSGPAARTA
ncbi:hypothetical protein [Streptomyces lichenis]|uniref:Uncharacterized protein n=1 Tax=Streptomyces lichenis TaxID=2306967 RepID=A0ABT0I447_9ACTN|nr:hypothetical protein [Streptomyces lichenis]MCK8676094.1 hypothetical protein [Streptomyces lichenis]